MIWMLTSIGLAVFGAVCLVVLWKQDLELQDTRIELDNLDRLHRQALREKQLELERRMETEAERSKLRYWQFDAELFLDGHDLLDRFNQFRKAQQETRNDRSARNHG